jgi:hypothetical protein
MHKRLTLVSLGWCLLGEYTPVMLCYGGASLAAKAVGVYLFMWVIGSTI